MKPTQPQANIKPRNMWAIKDFAHSRTGDIEGSRLIALYKLIQKRGEPIKSNDPRFDGVKALCFSEGEHIAMKRTGPTDKFYPCAIKTILLTEL